MNDIIAIIITILVVGGTGLLAYKIIKGVFLFANKILKRTPQAASNKATVEATATQKPKEKNTPNNSVGASIITAIIFVGMLWYFFGGGLEKQANKDLKNIQNQVATDSVAQYGIASRNGSAIDRCVQAGMVSAAFLQAQDEKNYQKWKTIEKNDCARAGIAR